MQEVGWGKQCMHTMAGYHVISISLMSLLALLLCSMTHYNITMGPDMSKDAP